MIHFDFRGETQLGGTTPLGCAFASNDGWVSMVFPALRLHSDLARLFPTPPSFPERGNLILTFRGSSVRANKKPYGSPRIARNEEQRSAFRLHAVNRPSVTRCHITVFSRRRESGGLISEHLCHKSTRPKSANRSTSRASPVITPDHRAFPHIQADNGRLVFDAAGLKESA